MSTFLQRVTGFFNLIYWGYVDLFRPLNWISSFFGRGLEYPTAHTSYGMPSSPLIQALLQLPQVDADYSLVCGKYELKSCS